MHHIPELQIIDRSLWDRVKERQASLQRHGAASPCQQPYWDRRKPRYLFSGIIKCGQCGGGYSKRSAILFGCSNARNKGNWENRLNIRRDVIEASVLSGLREHLMDPALFKEFADEFYRELNRLQGAAHSKLDSARAELGQIDRKPNRIVDAIASGVDALSSKTELLGLEARQSELQTLLKSAEEPGPLLRPKLAEACRQ